MDAVWLQPLFQACELATTVMLDAEVARRWSDDSELAGMTIGGVAAHMYAGMRRFEVALDEQPATSPRVLELSEFYGLNRVNDVEDLADGWHPILRDDAERRASFGHAAVVGRFGRTVAGLRERLMTETPERLVPIWTVVDGVTPLTTYIATRVVELVVHSDDLAVSIGRPLPEIPTAVADVVFGVFIEMARHRSGDIGVIRAFARTERATADALRVL